MKKQVKRLARTHGRVASVFHIQLTQDIEDRREPRDESIHAVGTRRRAILRQQRADKLPRSRREGIRMPATEQFECGGFRIASDQ
jgi:hypothetical protein